MKKSKAFPNEFFNSPDEYVEFAKKHQVFGLDAIKLKKEMNKKVQLLEPKIYVRKRKAG